MHSGRLISILVVILFLMLMVIIMISRMAGIIMLILMTLITILLIMMTFMMMLIEMVILLRRHEWEILMVTFNLYLLDILCSVTQWALNGCWSLFDKCRYLFLLLVFRL